MSPLACVLYAVSWTLIAAGIVLVVRHQWVNR